MARKRIVAGVSIAITLLVLDLVFLGILAKPLYDEALGPLRRAQVYWPAALVFYAFYVAVIAGFAVLPAASGARAFKRGAGLGFVAYATYELTNWAVLAGWPAVLVPVDIAWGVVLTGTCSWVGYQAAARWG